MATWVWIRVGCLEEGTLELSDGHCWRRQQQTKPRVHPTLCDACLWLL